MTSAARVVILASLLASCSAAHDGADGGAADGDDAAPPLLVPITSTEHGTIGPFHVAAGEERTVCLVYDLGNEEPVMLRGVRTHLTPGSHHLIVATANDETEPHDPVPCQPFPHGAHATIFIAETQEAALAYPPDAGFPLLAHQLIGLEIHYINYVSPDPIDVMGTVELDLSADDDRLRRVYVLFTGTAGIWLPPHEETIVEYDYPIVMGSELFALTTHTHSLGHYASLEIRSEDGRSELVHESRSWSDPPLTVFAPTRVFAYGDSIHLTCDYINTRDTTVQFGLGFEDEMCFFWMYYMNPPRHP